MAELATQTICAVTQRSVHIEAWLEAAIPVPLKATGKEKPNPSVCSTYYFVGSYFAITISSLSIDGVYTLAHTCSFQGCAWNRLTEIHRFSGSIFLLIFPYISTFLKGFLPMQSMNPADHYKNRMVDEIDLRCDPAGLFCVLMFLSAYSIQICSDTNLEQEGESTAKLFLPSRDQLLTSSRQNSGPSAY